MELKRTVAASVRSLAKSAQPILAKIQALEKKRVKVNEEIDAEIAEANEELEQYNSLCKQKVGYGITDLFNLESRVITASDGKQRTTNTLTWKYPETLLPPTVNGDETAEEEQDSDASL